MIDFICEVGRILFIESNSRDWRGCRGFRCCGKVVISTLVLKASADCALQDGMRNGAGTSYSNDRHGYDRQGYDRQGYDRQGYDTHYDSRLPFHDSSSNDRHEPSLEETDRAIALALAEEEQQSSSERHHPSHVFFCFCVYVCDSIWSRIAPIHMRRVHLDQFYEFIDFL